MRTKINIERYDEWNEIIRKGSDVVLSMYMFENLFYKSERVDTNNFPLLSKDEFTNMETEAYRNTESVYCFAYYRHMGTASYVDIYIWDVMLQNKYKRFVIAEDCSFSQEDEKQFLDYFSGKIIFEENRIKRLVDDIEDEHKQIHIKLYPDLRHVLLHIYYTFHKNGIYEILFKANLNWIAVNLDKIEDYNIIGNSPQEIFNTHIEILRAMNYSSGIENIISLQDRLLLNEIYAVFHNFINGKEINKYQVTYLKNVYYQEEKLNKKMYLYLGGLWNDPQYYAYLNYLEYKQVVDYYYPILPKYPMLVELEKMCEVCDLIERYAEEETYLNRFYLQFFYSYKRKYKYENGKYEIVVPKDILDILRESAEQHNCLYNYVWRIALGDTAILFMRDKESPSKSLVTLEVKNGVILQAYRAFNKSPAEEEQEFIGEFAKEKNLKFDINYNEFDDDYWIEDDNEIFGD